MSGCFRRWRRSRPFWGGVWVVAGGVVILLAPLAPLPFLAQQGVAGISGYVVGLLLVTAGLLSWWQAGQRVFLGVAAIVLSLGSFVTSNLGGFGVGMLAGLTGGALLCAWAPVSRQEPPADSLPRKGAWRAIAVVPVVFTVTLPAHPGGPDSGIEAARLTLWGGRVEGVVYGGAGPRLKLSMSAVEIDDGLHRGGAVVQQRFSRLRLSGDVVMYVSRMRARVGGVGVTFTPGMPLPPLPLPVMTVTGVEADGLYVRAAHARIEGLAQRAGQPGSS